MTKEEDNIGVMISDVARLMRTVFDRRVRDLGLTRAQWLVLTRLHRRPGASQSELADMMEIERPSAGRLIDRLEAKGWVARKSDRSDRRVNRLYLTREAERMHKRIWHIAEATVEDALADLARRDVAQLARLLRTVKGRVATLAEGAPSQTRARAAPAVANAGARRPHRGPRRRTPGVGTALP
ncbi:MAG: MarR family transcriptional regulator [Hyphomicrobiaceae bacterium]|nr:MarR family transcriptional regulator [Hyphomicrobiaceae bacterium]